MEEITPDVSDMTEREMLVEIIETSRALRAAFQEMGERASSNPMLKAITGGLFK